MRTKPIIYIDEFQNCTAAAARRSRYKVLYGVNDLQAMHLCAMWQLFLLAATLTEVN